MSTPEVLCAERNIGQLPLHFQHLTTHHTIVCIIASDKARDQAIRSFCCLLAKGTIESVTKQFAVDPFGQCRCQLTKVQCWFYASELGAMASLASLRRAQRCQSQVVPKGVSDQFRGRHMGRFEVEVLSFGAVFCARTSTSKSVHLAYVRTSLYT